MKATDSLFSFNSDCVTWSKWGNVESSHFRAVYDSEHTEHMNICCNDQQMSVKLIVL